MHGPKNGASRSFTGIAVSAGRINGLVPAMASARSVAKRLNRMIGRNTTRLPSRKVRHDRRSIFHGLLERRQRAAASGFGFFFRALHAEQREGKVIHGGLR